MLDEGEFTVLYVEVQECFRVVFRSRSCVQDFGSDTEAGNLLIRICCCFKEAKENHFQNQLTQCFVESYPN